MKKQSNQNNEYKKRLEQLKKVKKEQDVFLDKIVKDSKKIKDKVVISVFVKDGPQDEDDLKMNTLICFYDEDKAKERRRVVCALATIIASSKQIIFDMYGLDGIRELKEVEASVTQQTQKRVFERVVTNYENAVRSLETTKGTTLETIEKLRLAVRQAINNATRVKYETERLFGVLTELMEIKRNYCPECKRK